MFTGLGEVSQWDRIAQEEAAHDAKLPAIPGVCEGTFARRLRRHEQIRVPIGKATWIYPPVISHQETVPGIAAGVGRFSVHPVQRGEPEDLLRSDVAGLGGTVPATGQK